MKKPITILAVLLLLSTTAFAAEYPSQVSYSMNNGIFEVRKTYELPVDQEPSMQAKQELEQDGYSFTLTDLLRQELPEQQAKEYTETVTVSSESKELTAILPFLADTKQSPPRRLHWHAEAGYRFHHRRACRIQKQFVDSIRDPHLSQSQQHGFGVHPQDHDRERADAEFLHGRLADRQHRKCGR